MVKKSSTGAIMPEIIKKSEHQELDFDFYIKFYFITLSKDYIDLDVDSDCVISEELFLRNIIDKGKNFFEEDKESHVFFVDCSDCLIDEDSFMVETESALLKVLLAIECLKAFAEKYISVVRTGKIHVAVYGIDLIEDIATSFAYIVDEDCGLQVVDEKLCSFILNLNGVFDELKNRGWFLYVDYFAILDYYVLAKPIELGIEINKPINNSLKFNQNTDIAKLVQCDHGKNTVQHSEKNSSDEIPKYFYEGKISYFDFVLQPAEKDCLDNLQELLDWVSLAPGGEIASCINGFIYLTKEIKACADWDEDKINENKMKAIESFVGAIPGASIVKAAIKLKKASKIYRKIEKGEKLLGEIKKKSRKSKQMFDKIRQRQTFKKRKKVVKNQYKFNTRIYKKANVNVEKIIEDNTRAIEDLGLTIEDLTSVGMASIANWRKILRNLEKLPKTSQDKTVKKVFKWLQFVQIFTEDARYKESEAEVW